MTVNNAPLRGQTALVTGASRGIGRCIGLELTRLGANVTVVARSTDAAPSRVPGTIEQVAREIEALGGRVLPIRADLTSEDQVLAMASAAMQHFRRIDILVNNAAYMYRAPFHRTPLSRWDLVLAVNLRGPVLCIQALLPHMLEQGSGRILNISSAAANMVLPEIVSYSVSKAGLDTLTRGLANELQGSGVAVNGLQIETAVVTEGATYVNPDADLSGWERPEVVAACAGWILLQPTSYSGNILTMAQVRAFMAKDQAVPPLQTS